MTVERLPFTGMIGAAIYSACSGSWGGVFVSLILAFLFYFLIPAPEARQ
ncbi:hypothetical protein JT318_gp09 [Pseudomonas phage PspYZU01]|uniref:Uncharacterized protein n=1 Tax=Pseudomonas phage PspYZU01 TaxID=1983555 RepID=A0A2U7NJB5_9CAUD|nr:hypothetical protein JT318_gp09 [Pseudomonas phage PspYZU01]ASD51894.1 hypothetical protein PspYZU01_09 [Pseudomonas phage PspYZU01]